MTKTMAALPIDLHGSTESDIGSVQGFSPWMDGIDQRRPLERRKLMAGEQGTTYGIPMVAKQHYYACFHKLQRNKRVSQE